MFKNNFKASDLAKIVDKIPKVKTLLLGDNDINDYSEVECLKQLKELVQLDLSNTNLSKKEDYKKKIFEMIPTLEVTLILNK